MSQILVLLQIIIFTFLSVLHFTWCLGGKWGFENTLPTNLKGERVLNPKKIDSAIVGLGLLLFAIYYFFKGELIALDLPDWILDYAGWIISIIFILRAVGEFKYIGFFKKVKATEFGKLDTKYYSPLCLVTGLAGIAIEIIK